MGPGPVLHSRRAMRDREGGFGVDDGQTASHGSWIDLPHDDVFNVDINILLVANI